MFSAVVTMLLFELNHFMEGTAPNSFTVQEVMRSYIRWWPITGRSPSVVSGHQALFAADYNRRRQLVHILLVLLFLRPPKEPLQ